MLKSPGSLIRSVTIALIIYFIGTRNGRRFFRFLITRREVVSSLIGFSRRFIFYVPIKTRIAAIAAVLRYPIKIQNAILGAALGPQGDQFQSILVVDKATWKGCWISKDIQQKDKHLPLQWAESTASHTDMIVLYLHGGGFRFGMPAQYMDSFLAMFKLFEKNHKMSDVRMLSVDYSLSPGAAHPQALYECINAYRYLVQDLGVSPSRIIIAGDSAGGNITSAVLLMLKNQRSFDGLAMLPPIPLPAGAVLLSPWVVLSSKYPVLKEELIMDFIKKGDIDDCVGGYLPQTKGLDANTISEVIRQPTVSPFYGDFYDVCPLLVAYSSTETLANQIEPFIEKLRKSSVDVTVIVRDDAAHLWIMEPLLCATKAVWMEDLTKLTDWCAKTVQPPL